MKAYYNGKVYVDKGDYREAFIVDDGLFKLVGTDEEVLRTAGDCEKIDLQGRTVVPGFNDSHMHLNNFGRGLVKPQISKCRSVEEMVELCKEYLKEHPDANKIDFFGFNEDYFPEDKRRLPTRYDLDQISTEIPIILIRICGHCCGANSKMLEIMGIDRDHTHIDGGEIRVDENGEPNGILYEAASDKARVSVPPITVEEYKEGHLAGAKYAIEHGLTSVQCQDMVDDYETADLRYEGIKACYEEGLTDLRWRSQVGCNCVEGVRRYVESDRFMESKFDDKFNMGPLKMYKDGSLGARSALLRNDYLDNPGNHGIETISDEDQQAMVDYAEAHDLQVLTHVIGDRAIERTMNAYIKANGGAKDNPHRHCLVHCQITDMPMLKKIAEYNMYVSAQPVFLEYDWAAVDPRIGKELGSTSYATKTANDLGMHISYGTDAPVEDPNPMCNIYCAIARQGYDYDPDPAKIWNPQECVDVETAVDNYTIESAYLEFRENVKGRIKPGFYADFVVLDHDIFTSTPDVILKTLPVLTVIGGKHVYEK